MSTGTIDPQETALILAAHGSSANADVNMPLVRMAERIGQQSSFAPVRAAFLDGEPNIRQALDNIDRDRAIVIPFMTSSGYYTNVVFPDLLQSDRIEATITAPIGERAEMKRLVAERLDWLLREHCQKLNPTIIVVGHGTKKNRTSCLTTIDLVRQLRAEFSNAKIQFAFIDQNPGIDHVAAKLTASSVIVIPFLMGLGPHTTNDVPQAFGLPALDRIVFESTFEFPYIGNSSGRTIIYDAPVGTYPQWADICVTIARERLCNLQRQAT